MLVKKLTTKPKENLIALRDGVSRLKNHYGISHGDLAIKCQVGDSMITNLLKGRSTSHRCLRIIQREINKKRKRAIRP